MGLTTTGQPEAGGSVAVRVTPAQAKDIAAAIRSELACACGETLAAPVPGREDIARLRAIIDIYADELEMLQWGEPSAALELECPTYLLDRIAQELLQGGEETIQDHDVAVCAVVVHLLEQFH